jgi:hypothetical protein
MVDGHLWIVIAEGEAQLMLFILVVVYRQNPLRHHQVGMWIGFPYFGNSRAATRLVREFPTGITTLRYYWHCSYSNSYHPKLLRSGSQVFGESTCVLVFVLDGVGVFVFKINGSGLVCGLS